MWAHQRNLKVTFKGKGLSQEMNTMIPFIYTKNIQAPSYVSFKGYIEVELTGHTLHIWKRMSMSGARNGSSDGWMTMKTINIKCPVWLHHVCVH